MNEGRSLVEKTRKGIEAHLNNTRYDPGPKDKTGLWQRHGVFVTITENGGHTLRGCIGNPEPVEPLVVEAIKAGILAATSDPRFVPVTFEEMKKEDCLELTVMSPLERIDVKDSSRLKESITIGRHGIVIEGYGQRGLLLPQVAVEEGFDPEDLVTNCCLKAGLPPDVWLADEVATYRFTGQIFSEENPNGTTVERKLVDH